jgi:hypothetical protein
MGRQLVHGSSLVHGLPPLQILGGNKETLGAGKVGAHPWRLGLGTGLGLWVPWADGT